MVEIKFCGMTRPEDAREAAALGAAYVGVILADGPRKLTATTARTVLGGVPPGVARVGVFGAAPARSVASRARELGLNVVQLHGDPTPSAQSVEALRREWNGIVWVVLRVSGVELPHGAPMLFEVADGVVLDASVPGKLGGTGVALPWNDLRARITPFRRRRARLVLAGGLRPENVASAIEALHPDVVDVSSGVEAGVGVKDHGRMRAFRDAVHGQQR